MLPDVILQKNKIGHVVCVICLQSSHAAMQTSPLYVQLLLSMSELQALFFVGLIFIVSN